MKTGWDQALYGDVSSKEFKYFIVNKLHSNAQRELSWIFRVNMGNVKFVV